MNRPPIATLTWGTVAGAVVSACLLAAGESGLPDAPAFARPGQDAHARAPLPTEAPAAGALRRAGKPLAEAGSNPSTAEALPH